MDTSDIIRYGLGFIIILSFVVSFIASYKRSKATIDITQIQKNFVNKPKPPPRPNSKTKKVNSGFRVSRDDELEIYIASIVQRINDNEK